METQELDHIKASVYQLIELINQANGRIKAHREAESGDFDLEQWQELKNRYTAELLELLKDFELPLQISET
ncbi:MAG: hypothetical protein MUE85_09855 [Microscillaceae bacterium]|jgi:hypothetical protein|nr:hypothetical protein [Microscillaceae bacterium]